MMFRIKIRFLKLSGLLVTLVLFMQILSVPFTAGSGADTFDVPDSFVSASETVLPDAVATARAELDELLPPIQESEVPRLIGYRYALEQGYVRRLYENETELNQVVFLKRDGTVEEFFFAFPVKYVDENGVVRDKAPEIKSVQIGPFGYQTQNSDVQLSFGVTAQAGVCLQTDKLNVTIRPKGIASGLKKTVSPEQIIAESGRNLTQSSAAMQQIQSNTLTSGSVSVDAIAYAVGTGETLRFAPTYTGVNMQLALAANGANDTFVFTLETNGLILQRQEDALLLFDKQGTAVAVMGDFMAADGTVASVSAQTVTEAEEYLLSVSVPRSADAAVMETSFSEIYNDLQDASLYSTNQTAYGSSRHLFVGRLDAVSGIGRAVIRPNSWPTTSSSYPDYRVESAQLIIRDVMGSDPLATVECREFTGSEWEESTATWNSVGGGSYGQLLSQNDLSSSIGWDVNYTYYYDIQPLVQRWFNQTSSWKKGLVLRSNDACEAGSTMIEKTIASSEYPTEAYRPYIRVSYEVTPVLEDGIYFLKNKQTGAYTDIRNQTMANGTIIHQWEYHGGTTQQWVFTYIGNGYYTIRSPHSATPYYLGVTNDSSALNADIVLRGGSLTDGMQWKVTKTSSGAYTLTPKSAGSTGYVLSTSSTSSENGVKLVQDRYVSNSSYQDEWIILRRDKNVVRLDLLYDQAYKNRFSDATTRISDAMLALQEKYLNEFEIWVDYSQPSAYSSYADINCSTLPTKQCEHVPFSLCSDSLLYTNGTLSLQTYHHTNIHNIMLRIPFPDTSSYVRMAYIGHDTCSAEHDEGGHLINHLTNHVFGVTYPSIGLMSITNFSSKESEIKTTIHEFDHLFGVKDHYGGSADTTEDLINRGNYGYNRKCIHGEDKESPEVLANMTICDGCKAYIEANKGKYSH